MLVNWQPHRRHHTSMNPMEYHGIKWHLTRTCYLYDWNVTYPLLREKFLWGFLSCSFHRFWYDSKIPQDNSAAPKLYVVDHGCIEKGRKWTWNSFVSIECKYGIDLKMFSGSCLTIAGMSSNKNTYISQEWYSTTTHLCRQIYPVPWCHIFILFSFLRGEGGHRTANAWNIFLVLGAIVSEGSKSDARSVNVKGGMVGGDFWASSL